MNEALEKYAGTEIVKQISGHMYPLDIKPDNRASFLPMATSWGWGSWKRAWDMYDPLADGYQLLKKDNVLSEHFDLNGAYPYSQMLINQMESTNINSWAIKWWWTIFRNNGLTLFPDSSLVQNIGFDEMGTHTVGENPYYLKNFDVDYSIDKYPEKILPDLQKFELLKRYLKRDQKAMVILVKDNPVFISSFMNKIKNKCLKYFKRGRR